MKILIIHYRYFISGGPERYLFNLKGLLEEYGHKVIPFSIRYSKNIKTEFSKYFVDPPSKDGEIYFRDQTWDFRGFVKTIERCFYSKEIYNKLKQLIIDTKPHYAIVLQFGRKLSPSVLDALNDNQIPFIVRVSDFGMICANSHFLRRQKICELCINGDLFYSVRYKCVQNSFGASLINFAANKLHHYMKSYQKIRYYAVPSLFTMKKMIEAGFLPEMLVHVPTFIDNNTLRNKTKKSNQIIYLGRIDRTKGVHLLLEAIKILHKNSFDNFKCIIAGTGPDRYRNQLQRYLKSNNISNVHFTGQLDKTQLNVLVQASIFSVAPSLWYDNMPNAVLESLALGTPVIASNHGSFPEIIKNGSNGLLFEPHDTEDLSRKMEFLLDNNDVISMMSENAETYIKNNHSPHQHYIKLMDLYSELINKKV